ncbi:hypothetical protein Tco_0643448 [Tanacetum coccineum]
MRNRIRTRNSPDMLLGMILPILVLEAKAVLTRLQNARTIQHTSFQTSDEELEALMEDQPLPVDASPTTLSLGYIADSNPEEDEEDPKEDPADYPVDRGDNDDNESSDDDNDDDDDEKDEEDKEEEGHLAPADPSAVPTDDLVLSS